MTRLNVETAVRERYSLAANDRVPELCCPVDYDQRYLAAIPAEILERDYGCGDPSKFVSPGETVLDLGSGGGKICLIAAQVVGPEGRVIGVDCNPDMLALARKHQPDVARRLGFDNVEFRQGRIQDLRLDLDRLDLWLRDHPVHSASDWLRQQTHIEGLCHEHPLVADDSIDVVVSNCVLNLVRPEDRLLLFREMFRVLKPGGRAVISDITADREVPDALRADPLLWSGCISGAYCEVEFVHAFESAGFFAVELLARQADPWTTVAGIEFRSVTVRAYKPPRAPAEITSSDSINVLYRGPWKTVEDETGLRLNRGERCALSPQQAARLSAPAYQGQMISLESPSKSSAFGMLPIAEDGPCCGPKGCC